MLAPLHYQDSVIGLLEMTSPHPGDFDPLTTLKLREVLPLFSMAMRRSLEELESRVQAVIKEKCTAIHPSVEWRFRQAVLDTIERRPDGAVPEIESIVFRDVYPLYGASDIRGSSTQRNVTIQADLSAHLALAREVVQRAREAKRLPILDELDYRIDRQIAHIQTDLHSGDEVSILAFLRQHVEPLFEHIANFGPAVGERVEAYRAALDPQVGTIYRKRKDYEDSVTAINEAVSAYLDAEQEMAQAMFPHYFEKQRTDGVDYSIYVGASLVDGQPYDELYLRNLRLWQLLVACGIARQTEVLRQASALAPGDHPPDPGPSRAPVHPLPLRREALRRGRGLQRALRGHQEAHRQGGDPRLGRAGDPARADRHRVRPARRGPAVSRIPRLPGGHRATWADRWKSWNWTSCRACTACAPCGSPWISRHRRAPSAPPSRTRWRAERRVSSRPPAGGLVMKPFVVNRYGQIVFPFNFIPELDFSVFETVEQFAAVIRRDFEDKALTEAEIAERVTTGAYPGRYDLLRDLALDLFWVNRYGITMYDKRPTRWRDVPRQRDDVFLPVVSSWEGGELATTIEAGYRALPSTWDEGTEDKIARMLLDVFRHKKGAGAEMEPLKPTVGEILASPKTLTYQLLGHNPDYPGYGYDDIIEVSHRVPELEALMRQAMVLHNQYRWDRTKVRAIEVGQLHDDDFVVVYHPRSYDVVQFIRRVRGGRRTRPPRPAPRPSRAPVTPFPPVDVRQRFAVMPRLEALACCKGEHVCTNDDLIRNAAYCWSPMTAKEIEAAHGIRERLYTELGLDHLVLQAAQRALAKAGRQPEEIGAVLFLSCTSTKMMPSLATWLSGQLGMFQTHASCDMVAACAGLPYGLAEAVRLLQEVERPVLVVCGEKFSDKIGTVRTSRMIFGDGAAALVVGPAPAGAAPGRRVLPDLRQRAHERGRLDHLAQPGVRQQHHRVRSRGASPGQALPLADDRGAARRSPIPRDRAPCWTPSTSSSPTRRTRPWSCATRRPPASAPSGSTSTSRRWGTPRRRAFPSPSRTPCARASSIAPCGCSPRASGPGRSGGYVVMRVTRHPARGARPALVDLAGSGLGRPEPRPANGGRAPRAQAVEQIVGRAGEEQQGGVLGDGRSPHAGRDRAGGAAPRSSRGRRARPPVSRGCRAGPR